MKNSHQTCLRPILRLLLGVTLLIGANMPLAAMAQSNEAETPGRPQFLAAVGLLDETEVSVTSETLGRPIPKDFSFKMPSSKEVQAVPRSKQDGVLFGVDFATESGELIESLILTEATVALGEPEHRRFTMANLLVLRSFPQMQTAYPDARILSFGPVKVSDFDAVQMVGTFTDPKLGPILFRHVGILDPDHEDAMVAISNVRPNFVPVRGDDDFDNTYGGWILKSLEFAGE